MSKEATAPAPEVLQLPLNLEFNVTNNVSALSQWTELEFTALTPMAGNVTIASQTIQISNGTDSGNPLSFQFSYLGVTYTASGTFSARFRMPIEDYKISSGSVTIPSAGPNNEIEEVGTWSASAQTGLEG